MGVAESDTQSSSNATNYEYTYDQLGRLIKSRMAPSDLALISPGVNSGSLGDGVWDGTADWNQDGHAEQVDSWSFTYNAGDVQTLDLTSTAFDPTLVLLPPSAFTRNGSEITSIDWSQAIIDASGGSDGNARLAFTASQTGTWLVVVASNLTSAPTSSLPYILKAGAFVPTALTELTYTYDTAGNVHSVTDTSDVTNMSDHGGTTTYVYDALKRVTQITHQNASGSSISNKHVEYTYNADGSVDTLTRYDGLTNAAPVVATTSYRTPTGGSGSGYDAMGRLTNLQQTFGSTTHSYSWTYDAASNITQMVSPDGTDNYTLDATNQLNEASLNSESYTYDQNGNRTSGNSVTGANNRLLFDGTYTYTYDHEGNRTAKFIDTNTDGVLDSGDTDITTYTWDYHNRLVQETVASTFGSPTENVYFTYDFADRQIGRYDYFVGGSKFTYTAWDGLCENAYLEVTDPNALANPTTNTTATVSQRYLYAQAVDEILATDDCQGTSGSVLWGLGDHEGTIRDVVNHSGTLVGHRKYDSFGNVTEYDVYNNDITASGTLIGSFAFGFDGMRYDAVTKLYQTQTVPYDPSTGTRLGEDRLGYASGTSNFYVWAENNPVLLTDPSGMCTGSIYGSSGSLSFPASSNSYLNQIVSGYTPYSSGVIQGDTSTLDPGLLAGDFFQGYDFSRSTNTGSNSGSQNTVTQNVVTMSQNGASAQEIEQYLATTPVAGMYAGPSDGPAMRALPPVGSYEWALRVNASWAFDMGKVASSQQPAYTDAEHDQALAITMGATDYALYHTFAPVNYEPGIGAVSAAEQIVIGVFGGASLMGGKTGSASPRSNYVEQNSSSSGQAAQKAPSATRPFGELIKDAGANPSKWQTVKKAIDVSTNIRNNGGTSVQELLRNPETGEEIVRHTLLKPDGTLFEAPHFRPFWK